MLKRTVLAAALLCGIPALAADLSPDLQEFRALFEELVETNTTASSGSCTMAAQKLAARMKAGGWSDQELTLFADPDHPKDGGLAAQINGSDPSAKAILLLAHLDVVEARREDWTRDPFTLIEENGKFYGRGTVDDKHMVAIFTDTLIRMKKEGYKPKRSIKMALTCGEEGGGSLNGARWLIEHRKDLIDAEFAINEGGNGRYDEMGKPAEFNIEAGEKTSHGYKLEVTNPGGHSSLPVKNNAIYHLAHALVAVESHPFPPQFIDANRSYFEAVAKAEQAKGHTDIARAITAMLKDPTDLKDAELIASQNALWNSTMRTTCVATMLSGGHASNALPQRAEALVNCRVFPGTLGEEVRKTLEAAINDPEVKVTMSGADRSTTMPPLSDKITGPIKKLVAQMWPGVPVQPFLQTGATDGASLSAAGIPVYGIDGLFVDADINHIHGLNEYADVAGLYQDRVFLYRLIKMYAGS